MAYVVTKFSKYHSNVLGSITEKSHPDLIILPSGDRIKCDEDAKADAIWGNENLARQRKMIPLDKSNQVKFKILSQWEKDCDRSGSTIRWKVPKGSRLVWLKWDYEQGYTEEIEEEITV